MVPFLGPRGAPSRKVAAVAAAVAGAAKAISAGTAWLVRASTVSVQLHSSDEAGPLQEAYRTLTGPF